MLLVQLIDNGGRGMDPELASGSLLELAGLPGTDDIEVVVDPIDVLTTRLEDEFGAGVVLVETDVYQLGRRMMQLVMDTLDDAAADFPIALVGSEVVSVGSIDVEAITAEVKRQLGRGA